MIILNTTTALQNQTLIRMALQQQGLYLSLQQYDHYHQQGQTLFRHLVHGKGQQGVVVVDLQALLYPSPHARLGLLLHPRLAYRNIYKTGSTTIAANMNHNNNNNNHHHHHGRHLTLPQLTRLPWLVVVRDPLEHFLSGWGECGQRRVVQTETESWPYNKRILHWLNRTRERAKGGQQCHALSRKQESYNNNNNKKNNKKKTFSNRVLQECLCAVHSLAQVNYLYNQDKGDLYDNVAVVGDLRELPGLLQVVGAPLPSSSTTSNTTLSSIGRNSSLYAWRNVYPRRLDWLSNETLLELCRFLMLDYALLNYTPPAICREELFAEWSRII